jgi:dTDP-4-amino-4,6-dideoxygalactose transaminase
MQNDKDYIDVLKREMYDTKLNFEREKKEIDQAYKMEITKIEEKQDEEKAELLQKMKNDHVNTQQLITVLFLNVVVNTSFPKNKVNMFPKFTLF